MSLQNLNPTEPINLEQLVHAILPDIYEAVRWAYLQYHRCICPDELDDISQQIVLMLIEDNCRRFRSYKYDFSFKIWLQAVVNRYVHKHFYCRKHTEGINEINHGALTYSPQQDQDIYGAEKRMLLAKAIGMLNKQERQLYQLCFVVEREANKIADIFEIDVKDVYKRKHVLVRKLTQLVQVFRCH